MEKIKLKIDAGKRQIRIPASFTKGYRGKLTVTIEKDDSEQPKKPHTDRGQQAGKYDLSRFVGKLTWKGNAVKEQRKLRDEWK